MGDSFNKDRRNTRGSYFKRGRKIPLGTDMAESTKFPSVDFHTSVVQFDRGRKILLSTDMHENTTFPPVDCHARLLRADIAAFSWEVIFSKMATT